MTAVGLALSGWLGWTTEGNPGGIASFLLVGTVLVALEIALSFDNAIVDANKLVEMTPVWRQRFLTWGILIAVFGMRIVCPLTIVAVSLVMFVQSLTHVPEVLTGGLGIAFIGYALISSIRQNQKQL